MSRLMLAALLAAAMYIAPMVAQAQPADSQDKKIADLQVKIDKLEARVAALEKLVERFPDLDRTGCAVLYLGQMSDGPEKEQLLKDAIEKHGDCFYMNGVQVGAFGRYLLGVYYKEKGDNDKAAEVFEQLKK